jgi:hypothetical protein
VRNLARTSVTPVWLLLVVATAVSWWLGADQGLGAGAHKTSTVLVMTVAFIKVGFVGAFFMELRHAPPFWRLFFGGWCVVFLSFILVFYLAG